MKIHSETALPLQNNLAIRSDSSAPKVERLDDSPAQTAAYFPDAFLPRLENLRTATAPAT
jgi:hypothetical protein